MSLPTGEFEVAAACSGIRYLIASITFGCLYAYLTLRSGWRRALFVALAAVIPILANGLRAYGIVMLAHLSDMRWAVGVDHIIYGWLFFAVVISVLMLLGRLLRESDNADADVESDSTRNGLVRSTP
jgi:exosortase